VCWLTLPLATRGLRVAAVALLATALVFESARGPLVVLIAAVIIVTAARLSVHGGTALIVTGIATALVPLVASILVPQVGEGSGTSDLVAHQVEGLANPFDPNSSTLLGHATLAGQGLVSAVRHPLGLGVGAVTIGTKFGGSPVQTEADLSNVGVAFGLGGLVAFVVVFVLAFVRAYRAAARTPRPLTLAALGILIVTVNQWLNGGMYAVAWLPWLVLGWLDRPNRLSTSGGQD
jgi:cell division protein FtsW (lipid II flippase)